MNDTHLRSFIRCAESTSFSSAAQSLFISTNSLIQQMNLFESELGFKLFERSSRGISLTSQGEGFYREVKSLLTGWDSLVTKYRDNSQETMRLKSCIPPGGKMLFFEDSLNSFFKSSKDTVLEFVSLDKNWVSALIEGEIDYTILPSCSSMNEKPLYLEPLCTMSTYCVISLDHPLADREEILLSELRDYPILLNSADWVEVFPFLKGHPQLITYAHDLTDVYTKCLSHSIYLLPEEWAVQQSPLRPVPLSPKFELEILLIARESDKEKFQNLFLFLKNCWQERSEKKRTCAKKAEQTA